MEPDRLSDLTRLIGELADIRSDMLRLEARLISEKAELSRAHRPSARNLSHYLALRQRDLRELQERLASLGLSSLGRAESHTLASVNAVLEVLHRLLGRRWDMHPPSEPPIGFSEGRALLERNTEALLGPKPAARDVRIMVTMPSEAAHDYLLVRELLANGMDLMRINCSYDHAGDWLQMIGNLRRAQRELNKDCRILMDLGGPKLRTGPIARGPAVVKWRPRRDCFGNVIAPARIWLTSIDKPESPPQAADACLPVPHDWLSQLDPEASVKFFDARGASRLMKIVDAVGENRWAECTQTAYVNSGTEFYVRRSNLSGSMSALSLRAKVGKLSAKTGFILLKQGDTLILTRALDPGRRAAVDESGGLPGPATIGVTLPDVFSDVKPGEAVWLDDGKIGGIIRSAKKDQVSVEITQARPAGEKLFADKGINLPDSDLRLPALTAKDIEDLQFIAKHADLVGYSFVRNESDVYELQSRLKEFDGERLGIVLKIETRRAFELLPGLLLAAMNSPSAGVMIARGDLAVECGYERMAEVQEEILWVSEAAHMPVIWATQVLEKLAKEGVPSRAEITDAAMGERAECVMLNKGPYIADAVRALDDILRRMQAHQSKKSSILRHLSLVDRFFSNG